MKRRTHRNEDDESICPGCNGGEMTTPRKATLTEQASALVYDLRQRINPAYADQRGTESYERRECCEMIESLESAIEEQRLTIGALNTCIGGKDSTSLENITRIGELEAQLKAESDAHEAWQNEHLKVDGEQCRQIRELEAQVAELTTAIAAQKGTA